MTFTEQVAFLLPSFVVTVIVALPTALAVTTPEEDTVATDVLFEDHVTDLSVASAGETVAVNISVSPTIKVRFALFNDTPVTWIGSTVTEQVAFLPPSVVVTVMVVVPTALAVIRPEEETVATDVLPEDQVTDLSAALAGETVAVSVSVSPIVKVRLVLFSVTPVTWIGLTVTEQVAFLPPSVVVTEIVALPAFTAVTTPVLETVATAVLLEVQVTDLSVAFAGATVAVSE